MTTSSTLTVLDHSSDATFRAWGSENNAQLAAIGLVQTADTGQINWTTVTRPGVSTAAGYENWRFADSSIYLKIEYGTGTGAAFPQMWSTEGTGTNGTGSITGQTSTRAIWTATAAIASTVTAYTSRYCHITGAFSCSWKEIGVSATGNQGFIVVGKATDASGATVTNGFQRVRMSAAGGISCQSVRISGTVQTFNDVLSNILVPGDPTGNSTATTGAQQAYQVPMNYPDVLPFAYCCSTFLTEAPRGATFSVNMVGAAAHTFIATGQLGSSAYGQYGAGKYGPNMVYE